MKTLKRRSVVVRKCLMPEILSQDYLSTIHISIRKILIHLFLKLKLTMQLVNTQIVFLSASENIDINRKVIVRVKELTFFQNFTWR